MALWRLYYHVVWATKGRLPLITPEMEPDLYRYIGHKGVEMDCLIHAVGGIENHLHVAASIPPTLSVADIVGQLKGGSAHLMNHAFERPETFAWQEGYGVFSFGQRQLRTVVGYVLNQKTHHAAGTIIVPLERASAADQPPPSSRLQPASLP